MVFPCSPTCFPAGKQFRRFTLSPKSLNAFSFRLLFSPRLYQLFYVPEYNIPIRICPVSVSVGFAWIT